MPTLDDRLRERAGLLSELWDVPGSGSTNGSGGTNGANGTNGAGAGAGAGATRTATRPDLDGRLLRTREVALLFQVSERAVTDWARRGRLPSVRTPGGHRRYPALAVRDLLEGAGLRPS